MQSTDNPNAAMYEAEEKRRASHKAWLEQDANRRRQDREKAVEAMSGTGEMTPTPTQMEADIANMAATGAPTLDPQTATATAPSPSPRPAPPPPPRS